MSADREEPTKTGGRAREPLVLLLLVAAFLALSGVKPHDPLTWVLEVAPIGIGIPILVLTRRTFPLTPLTYRCLFVHALILMLGGHYTYAEVPLGHWVKDALGLARNHYDRVGHFAQGFVPALVAREVLLRRTPLERGGWLFFLVSSVCLSISACYEFLEWLSALLLEQDATAFLGTQGDPWDTQWDMFLALLGSLAAQVLGGHTQDRMLRALSAARPRPA